MSAIKRQYLRLWTVQRWEAWEALQQRGVLRGDGRRVDRTFLPAYHWMMAQMKKRLPACRGRFPVWCWHRPKPDLRYKGFLPEGMKGVRIEFVKTEDEVLQSDFGSWHCILNNLYLPLTETEQRQWEERSALMPPAQRQTEIEQSWERIFALAVIDNSPLMGPVTEIQAVVEEITLNEVSHVTEFISR